MRKRVDERLLAARGLFLRERITKQNAPFSFHNDPITKAIAHTYFQLWQKNAGGNGGAQAFVKRLALEKLTPHTAQRILRPIRWHQASPVPIWVTEITKILAVLPATKEELQEQVYYKSKEEELANIATYEALLPFTYYAERKLLKN